jgi:ureidoglycolate amidohydrolase
MDFKIDATRLSDELEKLSLFSEAAKPAVTRVLYSQQDQQARAWLKSLTLEAGLRWREDALGNTFIRLEGSDPGLAAVGTGSHIDAIPFSGMYDGTVGVLGGLEALRAIKRAGITPKRGLEVVLFTAEEPTRFGLGCLGSRAMAGTITVEEMRALRDPDGNDLETLRAQAGFSGSLESVKLEPGHYSAFIELHIEQGPLLEQENISIGLVTAIAAPASFFVHLEGEGGHAGARLMAGRRDALLAAAEIALEVEHAALAANWTEDPAYRTVDAVGTTGIFEVHPGAINSIPSRVKLGIDMRDIDGTRRNQSVKRTLEAIKEIGKRRNVSTRIEMLNADPPASSSQNVLEAARQACMEMGVVPKEMVSRAYHDSLFMARICPISMIFIPCKGGVSHRPDEFSSQADIARGVEVLARTMVTLANTQ